MMRSLVALGALENPFILDMAAVLFSIIQELTKTENTLIN